MRDDISDTNAEFGGDDDSTFLATSPQTPQTSRHSTAIETRVLDIKFPYSPSKIDEQGNLEEHPLYPTVPPPQDAHDIGGWVRFFSQSHVGAPPVTEPEMDSADETSAPLELASSPMTRMDTETCSLGNDVFTRTPRNEEDGENLTNSQLIGDDVVLEYILNGMDNLEERCSQLGHEAPPKYQFTDNEGETTDNVPLACGTGPGGGEAFILDMDKALPELRHRKDPAYTEPPSISLVEATPNATIPVLTPRSDKIIDRYFTTVPTGNRPPLPPLSSYVPQQALYYRGFEAYQHDTRVPQMQMQVNVQVASSALFRGSNGSFFIEPELNLGIAPVSMLSQDECSRAEYPQENLTRSRILGSKIPKAGSWMHSLLRRRHSSAK